MQVFLCMDPMEIKKKQRLFLTLVFCREQEQGGVFWPMSKHLLQVLTYCYVLLLLCPYSNQFIYKLSLQLNLDAFENSSVYFITANIFDYGNNNKKAIQVIIKIVEIMGFFFENFLFQKWNIMLPLYRYKKRHFQRER